MADFTEVNNFDPAVPILSTSDVALGGINGRANAQAKVLTNRTRWLYERVNKLFFSYLVSGPIVLASNSVANVNGSTYNVIVFPLATPDYITPNDGVTRTYDVSISGFWTFTEVSGQNVYVDLYTTNSSPGYVNVMRLQTLQSGSHRTYRRIVTLAPNTYLKLSIGNAATGANATFTDLQLVIKEI